jgi:hypothetical protein
MINNGGPRKRPLHIAKLSDRGDPFTIDGYGAVGDRIRDDGQNK